MKFKFTPIIREIMSVLNKHNLVAIKMKGDHIKINRPNGFPQLERPIILVNVKSLSPAVKKNLLIEAERAGINREEFERIF